MACATSCVNDRDACTRFYRQGMPALLPALISRSRDLWVGSPPGEPDRRARHAPCGEPGVVGSSSDGSNGSNGSTDCSKSTFHLTGFNFRLTRVSSGSWKYACMDVCVRARVHAFACVIYVRVRASV